MLSIKKSHKRINSKSFSRKYGHIKSKPDSRDATIRFTNDHVNAFAQSKKLTADKLVSSNVFDLRSFVKLPQALSNIDQGSLGSCTANAISSVV